MIPPHIFNLELPSGEIPILFDRPVTSEENDQWQLDNNRLRWERGDFSRSDTPVEVMFEM